MGIYVDEEDVEDIISKIEGDEEEDEGGEVDIELGAEEGGLKKLKRSELPADELAESVKKKKVRRKEKEGDEEEDEGDENVD